MQGEEYMKAQMKAIGAVAVVAALALVAVSGITYSWFSDSENSEITVSTGIVKVDTKVTDVGNAGSYIENLKVNQKLPEAMALTNLISNAEDKLDLNFSYEVQFTNSVSAKYYIVATTDNEQLITNLELTSADVIIGTVTALDEGSSSEPSKVATIDVKITIDLSNKNMGKSGSISIRNEIYQQGAPVYEIQKTVANSTDFSDAMTDSRTAEVKLPAGDFSFLSSFSRTGDVVEKKIVGSGSDSKVDINQIPAAEGAKHLLFARGNNLTFENLSIKMSDYDFDGIVCNDIVFKNCVINGQLTLYSNAKFIDCTFNSISKYNVWTWGAKEALFDNCIFNNAGKAVLFYGSGSDGSTLTIKDCSFNAEKAAFSSSITNLSCAAIEIDSFYGKDFVLNTEGNTIDSDYSGEWRIKNHVGKITVNNVEYNTTAVDSKVLTIDGKTVIKIGSDSYTLAYVSNDLEVLLSQNIEDIVVNLMVDNLSFDIMPYQDKPMGGTSTKTITINGNGKTMYFNNTNSDWNNVYSAGKLFLNNVTMDNKGYNADGGPWNSHDITFNCDVEMNNVVFTNAIALSKVSVLNNVKVSDKSATGDTYVVWICAGADVTMDNCIIDGRSDAGHLNRAIAIKDEYLEDGGADTKLTITNSTISSDKYAAILVTNSGKTTTISLSGNDISNTQDSTNAVWYDAGSIISITGGTSKQR